MDDGGRRVLMLAYFFPPLGGGGVQRTLKFVRHLAPLGWRATVVTTRSRHYPARDESLLDEVPAGTRVIRTPALPIAHWIGLVLHGLRLRRLAACVMWPDGGIGWAPFAAVAALRAARAERPHVLYSSSAPYGSHLAAFVVQRATGLPWVADFRDEWAANPHSAAPPTLTRLAGRAERVITSRAQKVIVVADYFRLAGLPPGSEDRVEIVNGVDESDFAEAPGAVPDRRFVLANVGTLYDSIDPSIVLRTLAALADAGEIDGRLEARLVGSVWVSDFAPPSGIRVERTGYVSHARAVREMENATALMLYVPSTSLAPSGKLFEYLASGRPILCLTNPENLASRLVREWDAGVVADPHDEASIAEAFMILWRRWEAGGLPFQADVRRRTFERYSRRANAERLAQVLEEVCDR